jgi:hypothetical protein
VTYHYEDVPSPFVNTDFAASLLEHNHHPAEAIPFLQSLVKSVPWDASYRFRLAQAELASNARDQARTNFIAVARDSSAAYDLRVQAARALAPLTSQPTDLGSKELSFIAHPTTVASARQPYFAEARIAAAAIGSTSASDRELLLREAIAIDPAGPDAAHASIDLLLLQPAAGDSSGTLAILRSLQNPMPSYRQTPNYSNASESDTRPDDSGKPPRDAAIDSPDNVVVPAVSLPSAAASLRLADRIRLATQIASASERDGNLESALAYSELAVSLAKNSPQPGLTRHRDDLKTAVLLARRNRLRQPDLHAELAQSVQVRPRLTASTLHQEESQ